MLVVIQSLISGSGQRADKSCVNFVRFFFGGRPQIFEAMAAIVVIDGAAIVGIDQIEIPQLGAAIKIGHAGERRFQQQLGQRIHEASVRNFGDECGEFVGEFHVAPDQACAVTKSRIADS